jgi:hypothetical protein
MWQSYLGPNQGVSPLLSYYHLHSTVLIFLRFQWRIIRSKYGFYIKHMDFNKYLQCQTVGANGRIFIGTGDVASTFLFEQMPDGTTMFVPPSFPSVSRVDYFFSLQGSPRRSPRVDLER